MKIVRFQLDGSPRWGVLTEPTRITPIIDSPDGNRPFVMSDLESGHELGLPNSVDTSRITWLPPALPSAKLICVGKNFAEHAKEMGGDAPELPVIFSKFASCLIGHRSSICVPPISQQVDFEAELVVVIGKRAKNIAVEESMSIIGGFTCGNDVTARDWQKGRPGGQWLLGKTFDTFGPLGPFIVTPDEIGDPHDLSIQSRLNGNVMQQANTGSMIYRIDFLISHLSQFVTLLPGDLIFTGTPSGVVAGRNPPVFLKPGDEIEVEISKIGKLCNSVVKS